MVGVGYVSNIFINILAVVKPDYNYEMSLGPIAFLHYCCRTADIEKQINNLYKAAFKP